MAFLWRNGSSNYPISWYEFISSFISNFGNELNFYLNKIEVKQVLKTNAAQLEIKDARLEVLQQKVARLEFALQNDREINSKSILKYVDAINTRRSSGKSGSIHRTCREASLADPSLTSGMHWIDPDGQGVGDDPIHVYCDMLTGLNFKKIVAL
jgi:hypothetical protein